MDAKQLVKEFVADINNRDVKSMERKLSDQHVFVNSDGSEIDGKTRVVKSWKRFFEVSDTYSIKIGKIYVQENIVVFTGDASGFFRKRNEADKYSNVPTAWKAVIENDKIKEWRIFTDSKPVWDILSEF